MNGKRVPSLTTLCLAGTALLAGCSTMGVTRLERVDSASVAYSVAGKGTPTVVFEAGLGDSRASWTTVASRISRDTRVFAYSRPGYGPPSFRDRFDSDRDGRRTGEEIATHLRALLDRAGLEPPFVLVGHSIGGPYVLSFAKLYPEDVAGIVLVDGRPPEFTAACKDQDAGMCEPPGWMVALMSRHQKAEVRGMLETERFAPRPSELVGIPVTVIAATKPDIVSSRRFQDLWLEHQRAFAQTAPQGRYVEAAGSTHYVHRERPGLVTDEIRRMLDQVRSAPSGLLATP